MNKIYVLGCLFALILLSTTTKSQSSKDSTTSFKVSGVCGMCENRIEKALKIKGVTTADWNADTKLLSVVF